MGNFVTRNRMLWGTRFTGPGGEWTLLSSDSVIGQGDLNGDGQVDIILRNPGSSLVDGQKAEFAKAAVAAGAAGASAAPAAAAKP